MEEIEKVYPINSKRKKKDGEEYIYKNYIVLVSYEYLQAVGITDKMYIYKYNDECYLTGSLPDGTVPAKKLSVHKQSKKDNSWKRIFTIPKKLFPDVSEEMKVKFTLDYSMDDLFNGSSPALRMELEPV